MAERTGSLRDRLTKGLAILAVLGVVVSAVISKGFEQGDVELNTQNLWVLHKQPIATEGSSAPHYGQLNTGLRELTSVNSVAKKPGAILQSSYGAILLEDGNVTMASINLAAPVDFAKESQDFIATIDSDFVALSQKLLVFLGARTGSISYSTIEAGKASSPIAIKKPDALGAGGFTAVSVTTNGVIQAFSQKTGKIYFFDVTLGAWTGTEDSVEGAGEGQYQLTSVGDSWVLIDAKSGQSWVRGIGSPTPIEDTSNLKLQPTSKSGDTAYFTTSNAFYSISLGNGEVSEIVRTQGGENSQPVWFEGNIYAAWLSNSEGQLFNGSTQELLSLSGFSNSRTLAGAQEPVIQSNGLAAVLNDAQSGWAWSISDGEIIPSTQDWKSKITPPPPVSTGGEIAKKQEPPVANDDTFGARPNTLTNLPVLLNDTDPNPDDVLTIDPESVTGWDQAKGTLRISADGQSFSVYAAKTATGSASFSYRVSDGSQARGALSKSAATVSVTFYPGDRNSAPVWCSDAPTPCLERPAPTASVLPGQSVSLAFAEGFVDPEGDKVFISETELLSGNGAVGFTAKGEVVFRSSLAKGLKESVRIAVTVSDSRGATTKKSVTIKVDPATQLGFEPFVVSAMVGQTKVVDIRRGIVGANGNPALVEVKAPTTATSASVPIVGPTSFSVTSQQAEQIQVLIKFTDDSGVAKTSFIQVNVVSEADSEIAVSPVNILVRAGLDSTVDLYTAISNASERALVVSDVKTTPVSGASLVAGKVKGGNLRVRGQTETLAAGPVGVVTYRVSDGTKDPRFAAVGQVFVYQIATPTSKPIGVDDYITIRAESAGDLDALANDVGTPGIPLTLDAKNVTCKGTEFDENGGLVFVAQGVLRIVAPSVRGVYSCDYTLYSSDAPTQKSTASFSVNVTASNDNRAPIAQTVTARVAANSTAEISIPLNGIDPDGDSVIVTAVGASNQGKGYAAVGAKGNSVLFTADPGVSGQDSFTYTISDGEYTSVGLVKVGIFSSTSEGGPVTMVDIVNLVAGGDSYAKLDPTANDFDSLAKGLTLVPGSLKPNMKEGTPAYIAAAELIKEPAANAGRLVTVRAAGQESEIEFIYSVRDGAGNVSPGVILLRSSKTASPDQPEVQDTIVDASQRGTLAAEGIDVVTNKVTWLTGDPTGLKLSIVGDSKGFRVSGTKRLIGRAPAKATFVVFQLSGKSYTNQEVTTFGILRIPAETKVISLKDFSKVWEVNEGETDQQDLTDWVALTAGSAVEVDAKNVKTSPNGRAEGKCSFRGGTLVEYAAGAGGEVFNDVCLVPMRYVGEAQYTVIPLRIRVIPDKPEPTFTNIFIEVTPGANSVVDLKTMVTWDEKNPDYAWRVERASGSSISSTGPDNGLMTFSVLQGADAGESDTFTVRIGNFKASGVITVIVGESPSQKPSATLTFDNKSCDVKSGSCALKVGDLTGVVNASTESLKFMPIGYVKGTPNYKAGKALFCQQITIRVTDANTVTATWDTKKGIPVSQYCPAQNAPGALLDGVGQKGVLKVVVDMQGAPLAPLAIEQVDYSRSTVTIRIKAGDNTVGENAVTEYEVSEAGKFVVTCKREGDEIVTTCPVIEDLRPYRGPADKDNLHIYSVKAKNRVGESTAKDSPGIYAYDNLKPITTDVIEGKTVLGRETSETMGVVKGTHKAREHTLAAKYIVSGEGGTSVQTVAINGDYKERTFEISVKPGTQSVITVRAEGAIPPPVRGVTENSTTTWTGRVAGSPSIGKASASILGDSAPYFGKMTLADANRKYSDRISKIAYVFWPGLTAPSCAFDESKNELTVSSVAGAVVKFAEDRAISDQIADLTSPDIAGLEQNVSYRAKVCYSNGFKMAEAIATNTLSTIADPKDGDYEYTVGLASQAQAATGALFSWVVKIAKSPTLPAGMKVQFAGDPTKPAEWKDSIYSTAWGEKPVIRVRYCNLAGTICSSGQTLVKAQSDTKSWQVRIDRAYLASNDENATELSTCSATRPLDLNFGVVGGGTAGWIGGKPESIANGEYLAEYQLNGSTSWSELDGSRSFFRALRGVGTIKKLRFWFQPNGGTTRELERVQVTLDVTC